MAELKQCPFCGGKAKYVDLGEPDEFKDWDVECIKCGIVMLVPGKEAGCVTTKAEARKAWNRRINACTVVQNGDNSSNITNSGTLNIRM